MRIWGASSMLLSRVTSPRQVQLAVCRRYELSRVLRPIIPARFYSTDLPIEEAEQNANLNPHDAHLQYVFLSSIVHKDPQFVIRRVESGRFALNSLVIAVYDQAREATGSKKVPSKMSRLSAERWAAISWNLYMVRRLIWFVLLAYFLYKLLSRYLGGESIGGVGGISDVIGSKTYDAVIPDLTFEDVAGNRVAKKEMENLVKFLTEPEKFSTMGCSIPKGVLLSGPPGVGKTLLAKALAGEANVPFFFASGSEFDQIFVGLGASRVRKLFTAAKEAAPSIIFIDEIDSVGMARQRGSYNRATLNQLLAEMDGFNEQDGVVVLAATNDPEVLDEALTREGRFDNKITLNLPSSEGRVEILEVHCKNKSMSPDVDLKYLAKACTGMSGAQLATLVNTAALRAVRLSKKQVDQDDLEFARAKVLLGGVDSSREISTEDCAKIAAHEAGHAIMELLREEVTEKKIYLATIEPRGVTLGHVFSVQKEDSHSTSNEQLLAHIDIGFGGRVAEDILYNGDKEKVTTGCAADMSNITRYARVLIEDNGYSKKQGLVRYSDCDIKNMETNRLIQDEMKELLNERYELTKKDMMKHKRQWERLTQYLQEYRTLTGEECRTIFNGGKPTRSPFEGLPSS